MMKNNVNYSLHPMDSILDAAHTLLQHKLHRLPLIDASPPSTPGNDHQETLLYIMNQYHILACLASWLFESSDLDLAFLDFTPESQGIGTFAPNLASVDSTTPLINLLSLFISQGVSSLPVLDSEGIFYYNFSYHLPSASNDTLPSQVAWKRSWKSMTC